MLLEVGKTYKTRSGDTVKIIRNDTDLGYNSQRPFFGIIKTATNEVVRIAYFSHSGTYNLTKTTAFDIVSELCS
jgi:hypothetical protein